jgi:hypothetical protein
MSRYDATRASSVDRTTSATGRGAVHLEPILHEHRADIEAVLRGTGFFREDEIFVALEVIDSYLEHPDRDYSAVGAFTPCGYLVGYVC